MTDAGAARFVRYEGTVRDPRGHFPGIFFLVNGLAREGRLSAGEERFRRAANDWYDAAYTNPAEVDPAVYDHRVNPGAVAWFKISARHLIERVDGYLRILDAHGVPCRRVVASDPGEIVYEDEVQVVVVPRREAVAVPGPGVRGGGA
ncbi:hypothetical protein [Streptomyces sp. JJ36]|uniref:hypothetical protein n=1 Tax=Streptomyces sp. JJ36 TaxID=2736645 RepID=UPI001F23A448|nr:hypothetical protein [Streptomyces sp. JJ36]MCF6522103.1 hypothetical protein [Streptomyces sp. JJ36]